MDSEVFQRVYYDLQRYQSFVGLGSSQPRSTLPLTNDVQVIRARTIQEQMSGKLRTMYDELMGGRDKEEELDLDNLAILVEAFNRLVTDNSKPKVRLLTIHNAITF